MNRLTLIWLGILIQCADPPEDLGACTSPPPGLVSWWAGDGNSFDLANRHTGASQDGVSFVPGRVALAFSFDGTSGYVAIPHSVDLNPTGPFSVDAWIQASSAQFSPDHQFLIVDKSHGFTDGTGWALQGNPDGTVAFFFGTGGNSGDPANFVGVSTRVSVLDDQWHHLAGVFTGGRFEIYVDGVLNNTNNFAGTPAGNNRAVSIGRAWGGGTPTRYFHGLVDEVDFFNRPLSFEEVAAIFAAGMEGKCKPPPSNLAGRLPAPGSIVYSRNSGINGSIWVFNPLTGEDRYLMEGTRPRLSPDGRYLVYLRDNGAIAARGNVYVRDLQEGTERMVYENHDYVVGGTFADEGRQVIFDAVCSILQVPRSGGVPGTLVSGNCWDDAPAADPFSGRVAFHNLSLRQIGIVNADGTGKHYLPPALGEEVYPAWSPDGQWLVVANADSIQMHQGPGNLVKVRPDGSERVVLTTVARTNEGFRANALWTLDGQQVLGVGKPADRNGIFRIDANGGGIIERLDTLPGDDIDWVGGVSPVNQTARGLAAWWRAEGNALDSAGQHHATAIPAGAYAGQGKLGQAFDFTGQTHLEVIDAPSLHFVRFTASAWVNFRSTAHAQAILSKATQPGAPESLALWYADGQLRARAGGPSPAAATVAAPFNPGPGAWYHVAYRFDGQTNTLFVDGVPVASAPANIVPGYTSQQLMVGGRDEAGLATDLFDGWMDELRLYSRALSDEEVRQLRRQEHSRLQVALEPQLPDPLTLSWPADDQGVLVETAPSLGELETWLPVDRPPVQVGATQILHLPLSSALGESPTRFWRMSLLEQGAQIRPVTITVRNLDDNFAGSLRQAINDAHPGDVIVFAPGLIGMISLKSGPLVIAKNLKIIGPGAKLLTISGGFRDRVLRIDSPAGVSLTGLTIAEGINDEGAGIYAQGSLVLADCVVRNHQALALNYGPGGGGILTYGGCFLRNCTIAHNEAHVGGGVAAWGSLAVENCTIAENRGNRLGGGIYVNGAELSVASSTISGNQAIEAGGGVFVEPCPLCLTPPRISNSLIAGNSDAGGAPDSKGTFASLGYNLIGKKDGSAGWTATGDQVGSTANPLDPKLGPLQDNGGAGATMAPLPGSKAIDQGRRNGLSTDQRGQPRPKDFPSEPNAYYGDGSDIGAVEVQ
jgi:hypothetical protein